MTFSLRPRQAAGLVGTLALLAAVPSAAADFGNISVNGYGHQMYARTSANEYLGADRSGSFKDNIFSMVWSAKLDDRSRLWAQITSLSGESLAAHWFYVDRQLTDATVIRAGKVLQPIGFYNEIIDARFLQKSSVLPLLYQPDTDLVDEAYGGVGVGHTVKAGKGEAIIDLYGGQIVEHASVAATQRQKHLLGARVDWRTGVDGLRLMGSVADKKQQVQGDPADTTKRSLLLSAEYRTGDWELRGEAGSIDRKLAGVSAKTRVWYAQAGYDINDRWQVFTRYDDLRAPGFDSADASTYQRTVAVGGTWRINSNIAFRLEQHFNKGYAAPVLSGATAAGSGKTDWQLLAASVNFIF